MGISIFAQVNINPTSRVVKFDVLSCYIHQICKMADSRFAEVTDKEISEIKINSVPKNTKDLCKNTKTIIRRRRGDYRGIIIGEPEANNCFSIFTQAFCVIWY